jgi:hypothetical protein
MHLEQQLNSVLAIAVVAAGWQDATISKIELPCFYFFSFSYSTQIRHLSTVTSHSCPYLYRYYMDPSYYVDLHLLQVCTWCSYSSLCKNCSGSAQQDSTRCCPSLQMDGCKLYAESSLLFNALTFFNTLNWNMTVGILCFMWRKMLISALSFLLVPQYTKAVIMIALWMTSIFICVLAK